MKVKNFFKDTLNDMQYLFASSKTLSKKEKKKKFRAWSATIGIILVIIQIILTVMTLLKLYKLDILPLKYAIALDIVLVLAALFCFTAQFAKTNILGKIVSLLLAFVLLYTFLFTSKVGSTLEKVTNSTTKTDIIDVIVLKSDKASKLSDTYDYVYGYNTINGGSECVEAIQKIDFDYSVDINSKEYQDWESLISALYDNTDIKAMIMNDAMYDTLKEQYEELEEKTKIVGTVELTRVIELSESDKQVNKEPFVIYISGNDEEGTIKSNGRSDVNILCIINPVTRQLLMISTPRDSYVSMNINGKTGYDKLTHAGNYGIESSMSTLENLYDVKIDYYVKINFSGCIDIINALGGITIYSSVDFENGWEAMYNTYHFVVGPNECDGEKTLAFCRERKAFSARGDLQRGENQMAALSAVIDKITSPAILTRYSSLLDSVGNMMLTNMPTASITSLVKGQLSNSRAWNIQTYTCDGLTGGDYRYCQITGAGYASVVVPYQLSIDTAKEMINKIEAGEIFDVDEFVEEKTNSCTNPYQLISVPANSSKPATTGSTDSSGSSSTNSSSTSSGTTNTNSTTPTQAQTQAPTQPATTSAASSATTATKKSN